MGINGILTSCGNYQEMAQKVLMLLDNKDYAAKLVNNAQATVLNNFNINRQIDAIYDLYKNLTPKQGATNILYYEPSTGYGGSSRCLYSWLKHLNMSQFQPCVIIHFSGPVLKEIKQLGIRVIRLPYCDWFKKIILKKKGSIICYFAFIAEVIVNIIPIALELFCIIKKKKIKLVDANASIVAAIPAIIASRLAKVPCVCHIHDTRTLTKKEVFFSAYVAKFIVLTQQAEDIYKKWIDSKKISVVYNGLDLEEWNNNDDQSSIKQEFNLNGRFSSVGVVGRIAQGKGHEDFVKAADIIRRQNPNTKFFVIGSSVLFDQKWEVYIKNLVNDLHLSENVIFTGWRTDIKKIMQLLDVVVFPSSDFPEGLWNALY